MNSVSTRVLARLPPCAQGRRGRERIWVARPSRMSRRFVGRAGQPTPILDTRGSRGLGQGVGERQRGGGAQASGGQTAAGPATRHRSASPRTPALRSPSVDSEADIMLSERQAVVQWGRAIGRHWGSGSMGRAPRLSWRFWRADVVALEVRRARAVAMAASVLSKTTEEGSDEPLAADSGGHASASGVASSGGARTCRGGVATVGPGAASQGAASKLAAVGVAVAAADGGASSQADDAEGGQRLGAMSDDDSPIAHPRKTWLARPRRAARARPAGQRAAQREPRQ